MMKLKARFNQKLKSGQYNFNLTLSGAIRGSSREKIDQKLDLEPFQRRRWYRRLCLCYRVFNRNKPVNFSI